LIYVYDASFIVTLIVPDEKNKKSDKIHRSTNEIFIPQLLWYEIANIFMNLIRRKRFTFDEVKGFFSIISSLNTNTDFETGVDYSKKIWNLCNEYNLSAYNAAYLELAYRKKAVLCTLDDGLINAAKKHGVAVIKH
jgi:predicted nucleic acid-binding protein